MLRLVCAGLLLGLASPSHAVVMTPDASGASAGDRMAFGLSYETAREPDLGEGGFAVEAGVADMPAASPGPVTAEAQTAEVALNAETAPPVLEPAPEAEAPPILPGTVYGSGSVAPPKGLLSRKPLPEHLVLTGRNGSSEPLAAKVARGSSAGAATMWVHPDRSGQWLIWAGGPKEGTAGATGYAGQVAPVPLGSGLSFSLIGLAALGALALRRRRVAA